MAAAFALGAEGVQMGTRMVSAKESPIHDGWKSAITSAAEIDTVLVKPPGAPALRCIRTEKTEALEQNPESAMMDMMGNIENVYFKGQVDKGIALTGQVAGRIDAVRPVADIIGDMKREFFETIGQLSSTYPAS